MAPFIRERLYELMKDIQEHGVSSKMYAKKPYLFTGSWMEGVESINKLLQRFSDCSGQEAALRVFNVLCPYEKELPQIKGNEKAMGEFYGEKFEEKMFQKGANFMVSEGKGGANMEAMDNLNSQLDK